MKGLISVESPSAFIDEKIKELCNSILLRRDESIVTWLKTAWPLPLPAGVWVAPFRSRNLSCLASGESPLCYTCAG